jgi:hypothetical protein
MRGGARRGKVHFRCPFQGARRALADAPGPHILLEAGGQLPDSAELLPPLAASRASAQAHEKLSDGAGVRCGDGSAKRTARRAPTCLGVARWRLRPGPRARAQGASCKIAHCADNMAAEGRRVVGGGRGTCCGTCEAVRAPQDRHLTALCPAGGAGSRENLLRTMPWYPCNSINTAIREISPSAGNWHIAPYPGHYIRKVTGTGTIPAI